MNKLLYLCCISFAIVCIGESVQGLHKTAEIFDNKSIALSQYKDDTLLHDRKSRTKRYVTFNVLAPVDLGLLIAIPITLILPSMANLFNTRFRRSPADVNQETYEDDPAVQPHVERVSNYFDLLQIPDKDCHQRAICELSSSPEKYYPLSELVLQRIKNPANVPSHVIYQEEEETSSPNKSLFRLYNKAADHGMLHGDQACHQRFSNKCPHSIDKRLNMPVLRFWNALKTLLKFTIKDN